MSKYPPLAAVCYLISFGGHPKGAERAFRKLSDADAILGLLKCFISKCRIPIQLNDFIVTVSCILCDSQFPPFNLECCKMENSQFCPSCFSSMRRCPCCCYRSDGSSFSKLSYSIERFLTITDDVETKTKQEVYLNNSSRNSLLAEDSSDDECESRVLSIFSYEKKGMLLFLSK